MNPEKGKLFEEDDKAKIRIGTLLYNLEFAEQERDEWKERCMNDRNK